MLVIDLKSLQNKLFWVTLCCNCACFLSQGLTTVTSLTRTKVTLNSTLVQMNSSVAPNVGSRMTSVKFTSSQIRSTTVTPSSTSSVTPLVTTERSTIVFTPFSSVEAFVSSEVTQVDTSAFTRLSVTLTSRLVTPAKSTKLAQSSTIVSHRTSVTRSVTPNLTARVTPSSTRVKSTQIASSLENTSVTSTLTLKDATSVTFLVTPSVTFSFQTSVTTFPFKPSSVPSTVLSSIPKSQTSLSLILSVTSRVTSSVPSLLTPSVTSGVFGSMTTATSVLSKATSATSIVSTSSLSLKKSSLTSTTSSVLNVTQSSDQLSSKAVLPSLSVTSLVTRFSSSTAWSSSKQFTVSRSVSLVKTARLYSSRFSPVTKTSVTQPSSPSMLSTPHLTLSSKKTTTLSPSASPISSVVSAESSVVSRISIRSSSAVSFASSKSIVILNSSFESSRLLSFSKSGIAGSGASLSLSRAVVTPFLSRHVTSKSRNLVLPSQFSSPFLSVSLSTFPVSSTVPSFSRDLKSSLVAVSSQLLSTLSFFSDFQFSNLSRTLSSIITNTTSTQPTTSNQVPGVLSSTKSSYTSTSQTVVLATKYSPPNSIFFKYSSTHTSISQTVVLATKYFSPNSIFSKYSSTHTSISQTVVLATKYSSRHSSFSKSFHFSSILGTLQSSSSVLLSSNTTWTVTPTDSTVTLSVTPSSTVVIPTNSPPRLYNNMGRVSARAGKALYFTIPDDTFYDSEDRASTRNLSLSVSLANGTSIPSDFWLQFDNASQTIYGLPLSAHVPSGIIGEGFILRAQDSRGAEALDAFEVLVVPSEKPVVQELRVRIANDFLAFNRNVTQRLLLLKKIADYYGDPDRSLIRVLSFTPGSVIMTWTNDSLLTDSCDEEKLDYVANKVLLPDGEVREEFTDALQGFPVQSASQGRLGVCNGSEPDTGTPITAAPVSKIEGDLWHKHVLVGVLVVLIVLVLVALLIWYCRRRRPKPSNEKHTFKKRKPIVLGPEIELKPMPGKPLVLPDDDPSLPPSYISETSLDKPMYSDDEDEEDYGKRSPSVVYEPPPPFHAALAEDPRSSPPPMYLLPPVY